MVLKDQSKELGCNLEQYGTSCRSIKKEKEESWEAEFAIFWVSGTKVSVRM
jgi:hypothetical protein